MYSFRGALLGVVLAAVPLPAAEVKIVLPLARKVYQTNERIDLSVVRSAKEALPAGDLVLTLRGADGSKLSFTFPVKKAEPGASVEHLHVNGWLLRPGKYQVEATSDGASANSEIEVYGHLRRSTFRLIHWKQGAGKGLVAQGEDNLGYNLYYGQGPPGENSDLIRAGVDFMSNCTMSGGHQMDLRQDCDWSDPYVIRGGTRRVVRRAFMDRTQPNVPGVHFYDEPGLTWRKDPRGGETPQGIPSQLASYEAAFGHPLRDYFAVDPKNPYDVALWDHWARWKLGFMDAAWKDAQFGVSSIRPDYLSVTQSQYGWTAFTDGYYYNVVRSMPVISGHGGYHDFGPGYFNPSYFLEFARARDLARPNWYLPTWYGNTTDDQFRLEQYLSFQTNIQGMMSPPDLEAGEPEKCKAAAGIVESNHLMGRLGTIFTTMPVTRPPVAVLYSLSAMIKKQTEDMNFSYSHASVHGKNLMFTYLAGKLLQQPFMPVVEEDIRDGTLAADHKAIILTSLEYLDPKVIANLEDFARRGGLILLTGDCKVQVKGGVNLGVTPAYPNAARVAKLEKAANYKELAPLTQLRQALAGARPLAAAIRPHLEKASIKPVFTCDAPGICATRQAAGDIEYLFAVNATHDDRGPDGMLGMTATDAQIGLTADDRPIYDAIHGGLVAEFKDGALKDNVRAGKFRFGPAQMRVFARTTRPIGTIKTSTPLLRRDYTSEGAPISVEISAALMDAKGGLLTGSVPLGIRLIDSLGSIRYDLYRATDGGTIKLRLPLAINDPAGLWKIEVTELLNNTHDVAAFNYQAVPTCSATAGATRRAIHLVPDRDNVFRFFRTHGRVAIVKGSSPYNQPAADRLVRILKPWNVTCTVVNAADVNKPRVLTEQEASTWVGLDFAGKGQIKPGDKNSPALAGFAVQGPVILLGTPADNPLIKFLKDQHFLPYEPGIDLPGPNRGLVAWQRDGIGALQESITLIAYDEKGMAEAVGSMYEMLAGIEPLTPLALPSRSNIAVAQKAQIVPEPAIAWSLNLSDAIVGITSTGAGLRVLTRAGVLANLEKGKNIASSTVVPGSYEGMAAKMRPQSTPDALAAARRKAPPRRLVKYAVIAGDLTAVAYWGGTLALTDHTGMVRAERQFQQDITALAWVDGQLIFGDADGRVIALNVK
jgi:hypothetical protein